jgi:hypothetical protein
MTPEGYHRVKHVGGLTRFITNIRFALLGLIEPLPAFRAEWHERPRTNQNRRRQTDTNSGKHRGFRRQSNQTISLNLMRIAPH